MKSNQRAVNFPQGVDYGTTHYEHGRTWEYVKPGMWKSVGGSGDGGTVGEVYWDDILDKPQPIVNLSGENTTNQSFVSGGSY